MRENQRIYYLILFTLLVTLFSCTKRELPVLQIEKESPISWDKKEPCQVSLIHGADKMIISAKIRCRGGVSSKYDKHSFAVDLKGKVPLCNLPSDDDWVINANYIDKTFMRHKISYDLFRQMDKRNIAPRCAYVNVFINDRYEGLYVLMEKLDPSSLKINKKDSLAMIFKDPPVFFKEKRKNVQDSMNYYQQTYPDQQTYDKTYYMEAFRDFLFHSPDSVFLKEISQWVDIENIIDWHLLLLLTNNGDGVMKNFYLYKTDAISPFKITIWDYDHSFGRDGDNELNMMKTELGWERSVLLKRLSELKDIEYKAKLKSRWLTLKEQDIFSVQNLERHISENHAQIQDEVDRNFQKWPVNEKWYYDDNDYEDELDIMRQFFKIRIEYLDDYFNDL